MRNQRLGPTLGAVACSVILGLLAGLLPTRAHAQSVAGNWRGTLQQPARPGYPPAFDFGMNLTQSASGAVLGNSSIHIIGQPQYYGTMSLTGQVTKNVLTFQETAITSQNPLPGGYWCIKSGILTLSPDGKTLSGNWQSPTAGCLGDALTLTLRSQPQPSAADQAHGPSAADAEQLDPQQIIIIRDTAASICNTVKEIKGQKTDVQIQGEVRGQLNGLIGRLANVGGSGTGLLSKDEFEGLTQDATGIALVGDRECRERLFNKMFDKLPVMTSPKESPPSGNHIAPNEKVALEKACETIPGPVLHGLVKLAGPQVVGALAEARRQALADNQAGEDAAVNGVKDMVQNNMLRTIQNPDAAIAAANAIDPSVGRAMENYMKASQDAQAHNRIVENNKHAGGLEFQAISPTDEWKLRQNLDITRANLHNELGKAISGYAESERPIAVNTPPCPRNSGSPTQER